MKRYLYTCTNFIPYFLPGGYVGSGIAMFSYLTLGTNRAMFTYLTPGTNRVGSPKYYSTKRERSYSKEMGVIYSNFIKALLLNKLNLNKSKFKTYTEIINYLEKYQGDKLFTRHHITKLKKEGNFERVLLTPQSKDFIEYIKKEFPKFDGSKFTKIEITPDAVGIKETTIIMNNESRVAAAPPKIEPVIVSNKETTTKIETVTKPEPTIVINNANLAQATTTTTNNVQKSNTNLLRRILLLDDYHEGITFLLIQLPYLVWFLMAFKDNPDIMKYITENFGIEEYKAPDSFGETTELAPIEYDFAPVDFNYDDSNTTEADLYPIDNQELQEDAARDYADNSGIEYFDYFDYYHSKPDNEPDTDTIKDNEIPLEEIGSNLKEIGSSLVDNTKHASDYLGDKLNSISTGVMEGKQAIEDKVSTIVTHGSNSIKDKVIKIKDNDFMQGSKPLVALDKEVHIIDDQFSNPYPLGQDRAIDVHYAPKDDLQSTQSDKPKKVTNGKSTWWFPMLDFNNLNYFPSLFEKFNVGEQQVINKTAVDPINNKVDYVKALVNQLSSALELNKISLSPKSVRLSNHAVTDVKDLVTTVIESKGKEIPRMNTQINSDALAALEGRTWTSARASDSSSDKFSTYFYYADLNRSNVAEAAVEGLQVDKPRRITQIISAKDQINIENNYNALLERFEDKINEIYHYKTEFNDLLDKFNESEKANSKTKDLEPLPLSPLKEYFSNSDDFFKEESFKENITVAQSLIENKRNIEEINKLIVDLKAQLINFTVKIDELETFIIDFKAISKFDGDTYQFTGDITKLNYARFNAIRNNLQNLDEFKYDLIDEFNAKNDNINNLIAKHEALIELRETQREHRLRNSLNLKETLKINFRAGQEK